MEYALLAVAFAAMAGALIVAAWPDRHTNRR